MLGRFALHDDRTLFLFVFADGDRSLAGADPKALLRERYRGGGWESDRILEALDGADDLYFDPVSQIKMPRWSSGRVALIGDAAFCISLMGGQGSALAMIAAYVLAGELARADGDHRPAFDTYERLLTGYIDGKRRGAERFSAAFAPRTAWGLQFRNLVIAIFAVPGLARLMFGGMVGDTLRLPEYRWR
jgi:2-polyprenyl-6-methoxyphenol hydroxylase-like FAD-dependent oxidoreductase